MAIIKNLIRGDDRDVNLTIFESDGTTPFDLTGCEVFFTINSLQDPSSDASAVIAVKSSSFTAPTTGTATISITNADWAAADPVTPGTYWYDVQVRDSNGKITSQIKDKCLIISDITRSTS